MKIKFSFIKINVVYLMLLASMVTACENMSKYEIGKYYSKEKGDTIAYKILQRVADLPPEATEISKFGPEFKSHFDRNFQYFPLKRYYINKDSLHYYLMWKQAPSIEGKESIAIGGSFKMDSKGNIYQFKEIFNSYKMYPEELTKKGDKLFLEMIEKGNVDKYLGDQEYVEFPDGKVYYNEQIGRWKIKPVE